MARIFLITHGKVERNTGPDDYDVAPNPPLSLEGKDTLKRLAQLKIFSAEVEGIIGTGLRHIQTAWELGLKPSYYSDLFGSAAFTLGHTTILADGTRIPSTCYYNIEECAHKIKELLEKFLEEPDNDKIIITDPSILRALNAEPTPGFSDIYRFTLTDVIKICAG